MSFPSRLKYCNKYDVQLCFQAEFSREKSAWRSIIEHHNSLTLSTLYNATRLFKYDIHIALGWISFLLICVISAKMKSALEFDTVKKSFPVSKKSVHIKSKNLVLTFLLSFQGCMLKVSTESRPTLPRWERWRMPLFQMVRLVSLSVLLLVLLVLLWVAAPVVIVVATLLIVASDVACLSVLYLLLFLLLLLLLLFPSTKT